jgi:hypothetical protein
VPLTYTLWGVLAGVAYLDQPDEQGIRLNPWVFHGASVAVHAFTALVVFELLRRLLATQDQRPATAWPAFVGALGFALHPVQVEPVAWTSGMKDVLCGLLVMIALWQYVSFAQTSATDTRQLRRRRWHYALACLAFVLAPLAKPTAMITPLLGLILDVLILRRGWRQVALALGPWFVYAIPVMLWTKAAQPALGVPVAPLWARPLIALDSLAFYMAKIALPINMGVDYGRTPIRVMHDGSLWWTWIAPVTLGLILLASRNRWLLAAGGAFVAGVAPVLGLTPFLFQYFSGVADHYLYISMLGVGLAFTSLLVSASTNPRRRRAVGSICAGLLVAWSVLSFRQAGFWRDDVSLWRQAIAVNPQSFLAHNNYGVVLFRQGELALAEAMFRKSIELKSDYAISHDNLALVLIQTGREDEGIEHIAQVLKLSGQMPPALRPRLDEAHHLFGQVLLQRNRPREAAEHFRTALRLNPDLHQARQDLERAERLLRSAGTNPSD